MNEAEQSGEFLDFINNECSMGRGSMNNAQQSVGVRTELTKDSIVQKIDTFSAGIALSDPGRFPIAARSEQKKLCEGVFNNLFIM